jgi:hypothetical protein
MQEKNVGANIKKIDHSTFETHNIAIFVMLRFF